MKLLIVEDESNLRESLRDYLIREGYGVLEAGSGVEAEEALTHNPSLVLLDWMLPDVKGCDILKKWRSTGISIPVILLTARNELIDKVMGLELGANDYITKPFEPRELLARVRVQLRDSSNDTGKEDFQLRQGGISMDFRTRSVEFQGRAVDLTRMEFSLLKLLMESPNQVFSRDELLNRVWGYDHYPTTRTIDTHVLQLRQKFRPEFFETVRGVGYRFLALEN